MSAGRSCVAWLQLLPAPFPISQFTCCVWQATSQGAVQAGAAPADHPSRDGSPGASGQGPCGEASLQRPHGAVASLCTLASCVMASICACRKHAACYSSSTGRLHE